MENTTNRELEIKYRTIGPKKMVAWEIVFKGTSVIPNVRVCDYGLNGVENNKKLAKKKAEHAKRLTETALEG